MVHIRHCGPPPHSIPGTPHKVCFFSSSHVPTIGRIVTGATIVGSRRRGRWELGKVITSGHETVHYLRLGEQLGIIRKTGSDVEANKLVLAQTKELSGMSLVDEVVVG